MTAGKSIVRDIYVTAVRVEDKRCSNGSTGYVFAVRPRLSLVQSQRLRPSLSLLPNAFANARPDRRGSIGPGYAASLAPATVPVLHDVTRTYSQCRALYTSLCAFTDCTHPKTCCCIHGSCPFWTMFLMLQAFPFPRKTLLKYNSAQVRDQRLRFFNLLMVAIFQKLQAYRDDFFLDRVASTQRHGCKVISALEVFLDLTDDVVDRFRDADHRLQLKLNLRGWQSDRKNLYFQDDNASEHATTADQQESDFRRASR